MKRIITTVLMLACLMGQARAQNKTRDIDESYRRSSLYSLMVSHPSAQFYSEIEQCFLEIPIPDSYNDHDLAVKIISTDKKLEKAEATGQTEEPKGVEEVTDFLERNKVASRMVAKWYNYDLHTGAMDIDLVASRGIYAASEVERAKAATSARGMEAVLADAGEDLIQNTFVLVNDITYIDRSKGSATVGAVFKILGAAAAIATNDRSYAQMGQSLGNIAETFKGFAVRIHTSLYQLVWGEEEQANLYNTAWGNREAFEGMRGSFKLRYVGDQTSSGSTTSFLGIREDEPERMVRKACQRAIDDNIADLQKNFQVFQIKSPLNVETMEAKIGKKEGVTEDSEFEVLERVKSGDGHVTYKKIGKVRPVKNLIWDNRYMAEEEMAEGATLGCTTFQKVGGGDFTPGCLIRQVK